MIKLEKIKCKDNIATYKVIYKGAEYMITVDCISGKVLNRSKGLSDSVARRVKNKLFMLYMETGGNLPKYTGVMTH